MRRFMVVAALYLAAGLVPAEAAGLLASDGANSDAFGFSVGAAGNLGLVGAYQDDDKGANSGAAYLFRNLNTATGTVNQAVKLLASDGSTGDYFGSTVSLSGSLGLVGAYLDDLAGTSDAGAAYLFRNLDTATGTVTQNVKLVASDSMLWDYFGRSVSLSGNLGLVGANQDDDKGADSGAAYVFRNLNTATGTVTQNAKLVASDGASSDHFGISVSLSGTLGLVGASRDDDLGNNSGSAYVYRNLGSVTGTHTQSAKLLASDGAATDLFGYTVSVSGTFGLVGAYQDDDKGADSGSAYLFRNLDTVSGTNRSPQAKLLASDGAASDQFGYSVSVSGTQGLIGARHDDDQGTDSGSAYLFRNLDTASGTVTQSVKWVASDGVGTNYFGYSVSLDGEQLVVGAYTASSGKGKAYSGNVKSFTTLDDGNRTLTISGLSMVSWTDWVIGATTDLNQVILSAGDAATVTQSGQAVCIGQAASADTNELVIAGRLAATEVRIGAAGNRGNVLRLEATANYTNAVLFSLARDNALKIAGGNYTQAAALLAKLGATQLKVWNGSAWVQVTTNNAAQLLSASYDASGGGVTTLAAISGFLLSYSAGAGGSLTGTLVQSVESGGNGTAVTAVAIPGYHFVNWSDLSAANPRTDLNVTSNITVTAHFALDPGYFSLAYTAGAGGTVTGTSPQTVSHGADGTAVTAVPNTGYHFVQWSDGRTQNPRTDTNVTENVSVTAQFAINQYTLTYTAGAGGTLTGTSPQTVNHGSNSSPVTAAPDTGYQFMQWELDGQVYSHENPLTVTLVSRDMNLAARFGRWPGLFRIERNPAGYFKIAWHSVGGIRYRVQYVNGSPEGAYSDSFTDIVRGAEEETDPGATGEPGTMEFVDDLTLTGGAPPYASRYYRVMRVTSLSLTYTASANGTIEGATPQAVVQGDSGTPVTAVPDAGYRFVQWSDGSKANPRTDAPVVESIAVEALFAVRTNQWTLQDFLETVKPLEHAHAQASGFAPIMGWAFPETPNYLGEAVAQRNNGTLQTKWSQYWSRYCVPWINLRGLPDPQEPDLMENAVAAALTFQDLGIPIHLFIDPWKWYMALATPEQFPQWGHAPYDFWPEAGVVDGHPVWWTDTGGVRIHPVYPWSINTEAYASMVYTLQTFQDGGIADASVGGAWSDYETMLGPFDGELEWQKEWYLAHPTASGFVNPYDALIAAYAGGNAALFWTGLNGPFAQFCWDLKQAQVTGGILQPVRDVFGTPPVFGEYNDFWSSPGNPTYDANSFPYAVTRQPSGVAMPSLYANNYFLPTFLGGTNPPINQANADAVFWFLMMRTASGSVANAPASDRHVFWVGSDCRDSSLPGYQYGMTRPLYREFLRHLFLRKASGIVTFTSFDAARPDISLPMYEDARRVLDEMLSYRAYLQDLPSTSTARKVLNTAYAPVFSTAPVWSGMANTSISTGDRWLVRVVSMSGSATNLTITPEPSFAGTPFTLAAPTDGATYLLHTSGTATRTDTRPPAAYLKLDRNYSDSSACRLAATGGVAGAYSLHPGFTAAVPSSNIIAAAFGLYGNRTNGAAVSLSGPSSSRGAGNFVRIPNTSNGFNTASFTVEGWVFAANMEDFSSLFSKGVDAASAGNWDWQIQGRAGGALRCLFASGDGTTAWIETAAPSLTLNAWHHVAMVCDNRQVQLYVDHVAQGWGSASPAGIALSGTTATLAWPMARHAGDAIRLGLFHQNFTGYIDEFRYTPEALSPLQMERTGTPP